ncbi:reverse transcriptase domain-containing protein [Tanacetum coccineum]
MEKLVLSLVFTAKRLRRYFQAHPIAVITDQPIKQIMSRTDVARRLQKWSVMLGEHNITYRPRTSVKGQILVDFLIEKPEENLPETPATDIPQEPWTLFTDGSSSSNNEAEYEALIAGLWIAAKMGVRNVRVLVEILKEKSIHEEEVATVVEEEGTTWMTPIIDYLKDGNLPGDIKEARKLRIKARQYELLEGILYKWSFLKPWLRYVGPLQADYVIKEIHEGSCSMHAGPRSVVAKAMRLGYYWPIMHRDAREMIRTCNDCQSNGLVERANRSLGKGIKARLGEGNKNWVEELPHVLWAHRTMIKSSHGDTPFSLTYGTEAVIHAEIGMPTYRTTAVDTVHNDEELQLNLDLLEEKRERTTICEAKAKMKMTKYYNARVHGVAFRPGDFVYHSNDASHAAAGGKLGPKWEGPYEITKALGDGAYKLRTMGGADLPQT